MADVEVILNELQSSACAGAEHFQKLIRLFNDYKKQSSGEMQPSCPYPWYDPWE